MAAASDIRKNFAISVDGRGYAGQTSEFNAPKITLKTEEYRGGGMDAAIDIEMGMEKLTCDFSIESYDRNVLALVGLTNGNDIQITAREVLESYDGTVTPIVHVMRGIVNEMDPGTSKPGELNPVKFTLSLSYYKMTHGGNVIYEIDPVNMVRVVDGKDQLAAQRSALGI